MIKVGTKVRIMHADGRSDNYIAKVAIITKKYCPGGWLIDIDHGYYWWPEGHLEVICCGAKGCMWHTKKEKQ